MDKKTFQRRAGMLREDQTIYGPDDHAPIDDQEDAEEARSSMIFDISQRETKRLEKFFRAQGFDLDNYDIMIDFLEQDGMVEYSYELHPDGDITIARLGEWFKMGLIRETTTIGTRGDKVHFTTLIPVAESIFAKIPPLQSRTLKRI